jgi:GMP reductase
LVKNSIYNGDSNQGIIEAGRSSYGEGDTIL